MGKGKVETEVVAVHGNTLSVTHIFDGEEVVSGGEDGQVHIATFVDARSAERYVSVMKHAGWLIYGVRRKK